MADIGDAWEDLSVYVYDVNGALADATTVTLTITLPDGTTVTPSVTHVATGTYAVPNFFFTQYGYHEAYWQATGTNASAHLQSAYVESSIPVVPLEEVKTHLGVDGDTQDEEIQGFIDTAVGIIEGFAGPIVQRTITGEKHDGGDVSIFCQHPPVISVQSLTELIALVPFTLTNQPVGSSTDNYGYSIDDAKTGHIVRRAAGSIAIPFSSGNGLGGYQGGIGTVSITYTAGSVYPEAKVRFAVKEAVKILWRQTHGGSASFQEGYAPAASAGLSQVAIDRLKMILGVGGAKVPTLS